MKDLKEKKLLVYTDIDNKKYIMCRKDNPVELLQYGLLCMIPSNIRPYEQRYSEIDGEIEEKAFIPGLNEEEDKKWETIKGAAKNNNFHYFSRRGRILMTVLHEIKNHLNQSKEPQVSTYMKQYKIEQ